MVEVNWTVAYILGGFLLIYIIRKGIRKYSGRHVKGMGMTMQNTLLISLLKNWLNGLPDDQRLVYEELFNNLIHSDEIKLHTQIAALKQAISKIEELQVIVGAGTDEGRYHRVISELEEAPVEAT